MGKKKKTARNRLFNTLINTRWEARKGDFLTPFFSTCVKCNSANFARLAEVMKFISSFISWGFAGWCALHKFLHNFARFGLFVFFSAEAVLSCVERGGETIWKDGARALRGRGCGITRQHEVERYAMKVLNTSSRWRNMLKR